MEPFPAPHEASTGPRRQLDTSDQLSWNASAWVSQLGLWRTLSEVLLSKGPPDGTEAERIKGLSEEAIDAAVDAALAPMKEQLKNSVKELSSEDQVDAKKLSEKFSADPSTFEFSYGSIEDYHGGLEQMIGNPSADFAAKMLWEHTASPYARSGFECWGVFDSDHKTTAKSEWHYVVDEAAQENGGREEGRDGWRIQDFINNNKELVESADLILWEVVALRLYTGPMYMFYNHILRWRKQMDPACFKSPFDDYKITKSDFPFTTTLHVLNSAIIKLARTQPAHKVYRGVCGGVLPREFWTPNEQNVRGGIELAFMSTTRDRAVALSFATKDEHSSMVLEIQMGMVDRGAPVQWISQFPKEEEILFAPLTGLEVVGVPRVEKRAVVIELRLNCNMHDLTIEQILSKMQRNHLDLIHIIRSELVLNGFSADACTPLDTLGTSAAEKGPAWYNTAAHYMECTRAALQCKFDVCSAVLLEDAVEPHLIAHASRILFDPADASALQHGVVFVAKHGLLAQYAPELECIVQANGQVLEELSFKDAQLTGPVPPILLRLCAKAKFFDFTGNCFSIHKNSYLRCLVEHTHNLHAVKMLDISNRPEFGDVEGVQYMHNLEKLCINHTSIRDFSPLVALPKLIKLEVECPSTHSGEIMSDITLIGQCVYLQELSLRGCEEVSEIQALASLTSLKSLVLTDTCVQDLTPIGSCGVLESLYINGCTEVEDLTPISSLPLQAMDISGTSVQDLSPLYEMTTLLQMVVFGMEDLLGEDDVEALQSQLPDAEIMHEF
jgi:hypothetical protein